MCAGYGCARDGLDVDVGKEHRTEEGRSVRVLPSVNRMVDRCAGCTGLLRAQSLEERKAVHLLPCCIACTGPAPVSLFFNPRDAGEHGLKGGRGGVFPTVCILMSFGSPGTTGVDGISCQEAAFRGRRLVGTTLELPAHFSGRLTLLTTLQFTSRNYSTTHASAIPFLYRAGAGEGGKNGPEG